MSDIKFVDGLMVKAPHEKAPSFVKAAISIKRAELIAWLSAQQGEWINLDVKEAKSGNWYASVNEYKPAQHSQSVQPAPQNDFDDFSDDLPF